MEYQLVGKELFAPRGSVLHIRTIGSPTVLCGAKLRLRGRGVYAWHAAAVRADYDPSDTYGREICKTCLKRVAKDTAHATR